MKIILFTLLLCLRVWSIEEGILKLDQKVKSPEILSDFTGAISIRYAVDSIKDIILTPPLSERSSYESTEHEASDHSAIHHKATWAVDLTGTHMDINDFSTFMVEMRPNFTHLAVLVLSTVALDINSWDHIFSHLETDTFRYVNVCGTTYANSGIVPVLRKGAAKYSDRWTQLSLKLIFADKTYYKKLKKDMQWYKHCVENKSLHPDWDKAHELYYAGDHKAIFHAQPIKLVTGDSDEETELENDSDNEGMIEGIESISLFNS